MGRILVSRHELALYAQAYTATDRDDLPESDPCRHPGQQFEFTPPTGTEISTPLGK